MLSLPSPAYPASRGNDRTGYTPTKATTTAVVATTFDDEAFRPALPVEALKVARGLVGIAGWLSERMHGWRGSASCVFVLNVGSIRITHC